MIEEIWKNIDNNYEVSSYGKARSKERIIEQPYNNTIRVKKLKSRLLTQQPNNKDGYLRVKLYNRYVSLSHLVATAFIPNPNNYTIVHHKDRNVYNNCADNLEWISKKEHDRLHAAEKTKMVAQHDLNTGELLAIFNSTQEAAKETNLNQAHICDCCNGKRQSHGEFKWFYLPKMNVKLLANVF